jgi:hypothetical protein
MSDLDLTMVALQRLSDEIQRFLAGKMDTDSFQLTLRTLMATLPRDAKSKPLQDSLKAIEETNDRLDFIQFKVMPDEAAAAAQRAVYELSLKMTASWFPEGEDLAVALHHEDNNPDTKR